MLQLRVKTLATKDILGASLKYGLLEITKCLFMKVWDYLSK